MSMESWHERSKTVQIDGRAFIGGTRRDAILGARFDCLSPIDGRQLAEVARCTDADVDAAVSSARAVFEDGRWAGLAPSERKRVLIRLADLMLAHQDELALLETLDMGKPIRYSRDVDVRLAQNCIRWYGEAIDKLYGEVAPSAQDSLALITREPVGVVAAIIPWNYPGNGRDKSLHAFDKYTELKTTWIQV